MITILWKKENNKMFHKIKNILKMMIIEKKIGLISVTG